MTQATRHILTPVGPLLLISVLMWAPASAQFTLQSTTPANGDVNVATPATFTFAFSAALDTSARFEEPDDFFLGVNIFPDDTLSEPDIMLSPDLKTVTVSGLQLMADTRYSILLLAARSMSGESLDYPHVTTFTTGSSLPAGSVSGSVSMNGNPVDGAIIGLFDNLFDEEPAIVGVSTSGTFSIDFVPDGVYYPYSVMDTNGDGDVDPSDGDAFGIFDPNSNGQPDSIEVSGGGSVTGVDIQLTQPVGKTARDDFPSIKTQAETWSSDAVLVGIFSDDLSNDGKAFGWSYVFYSAALDDYLAFYTMGALVIAEPLDDEEYYPPTNALPVSWVNSNLAMATAEANGGAEFRAQFNDAEVEASLEHFRLFYYEDDSSMTTTALAEPFGLPSVKLRKMRDQIRGVESHLAVWNFYYWSESAQAYKHMEVNAETGTPLATDVHSNLEAGTQAAQLWAFDAELIEVRSEREVGTDGNSSVWGFLYRSTFLDSTIELFMVAGKDVAMEPVGNGSWPFDPLPASFCNSTDAIATAQLESATFRAQNPDFYIHAQLGRGNSQNGEEAVWRVGYYTFSENQLEVLINAEGCDLLTQISGSTSELPRSYRLHQNYPNPFNPATEIAYDLPQPGRIVITVHNLLGQKVRTLVDKVEAAGSHRVTWDGRDENGLQVTSGVYLYRLVTGKETHTRRMLLVR